MLNFWITIKPYLGRIVGILCGLLIAILIFTIGFWRTLLLCLLVLAGYIIGGWQDGTIDIKKWIEHFRR